MSPWHDGSHTWLRATATDQAARTTVQRPFEPTAVDRQAAPVLDKTRDRDEPINVTPSGNSSLLLGQRLTNTMVKEPSPALIHVATDLSASPVWQVISIWHEIRPLSTELSTVEKRVRFDPNKGCSLESVPWHAPHLERAF